MTELGGRHEVLLTDRLMLRPHVPADIDDSFALWSDPDTTAFIGGRPQTREECWWRLLRYMGLWAALGYGYWAVFDSDTKRFVGEVGLADFGRDMTPRLDAPEAGWAIVSASRGRGYAGEALRAALSWADRRFERTLCIINPDNVVSAHVATKVGYRRSGRTEYHDKPIDVWERPRAPGAHGSDMLHVDGKDDLG